MADSPGKTRRQRSTRSCARLQRVKQLRLTLPRLRSGFSAGVKRSTLRASNLSRRTIEERLVGRASVQRLRCRLGRRCRRAWCCSGGPLRDHPAVTCFADRAQTPSTTPRFDRARDLPLRAPLLVTLPMPEARKPLSAPWLRSPPSASPCHGDPRQTRRSRHGAYRVNPDASRAPHEAMPRGTHRALTHRHR